VKVTSVDGSASVALAPVAYQYTFDQARNRDVFDLNWLFIDGRVRFGEHSWAFRDPCLLTSEWREFGDWLGELARGQGSGELYFLEPNVGFAVAERRPDIVRLKVYLSHESSPPYETTATGDFLELSLEIPYCQLELASEQAARDGVPFPSRR
jgi:hypothetical protein